MEMKNDHYFLLLFLCFSLNSNLCIGRDTISANESLSFGETLVSSGEIFELGFFRPANRDKPLDYGAAEMIISQGNLVLLDRFQGIVVGEKGWKQLKGRG
ncbi:hypothetical protein H5410_035629 [Solanum commersonii]|uniref:Uncharacterized protein n=1 Tax=Solanum commersonii TaxID=4109 RepID=A0A9J5Y2F3_SOLCO|nr:hypothetical protein H5410_035629 [Solanum commersonii]